MTVSLCKPDGLPPFYAADGLAAPHGFFTADGGVSTGLYHSLNCGFGSADDPALVLENRTRAALGLGLDPLRLVGAYQVHGNRCLTLQSPTPAMQARNDGPSIRGQPEAPALEQADALVTTTPGLGLTILTADCLPVLFADLEAGVVGACHAGWRGAVGGVVEATVAAMRAVGGQQITAVIGPTIRQPNYQVGADMRHAVMEASTRPANQASDANPANQASDANPSNQANQWATDQSAIPQSASPLSADRVAACFHDDPSSQSQEQKFRFDLAAYVRLRLDMAAVAHVIDCGLDTYSACLPGDESPAFFSHRRATHRAEPDSGRLISIISLP